MPNCVESKSSTERWCAPHTAQAKQKLPKDWGIVLVNNVYLYLNPELMTAQFNHPGSKGELALPRTSKALPDKPRKGFPAIFLTEPQPSDLLRGWEQCLAVPDWKNPSQGVCAFLCVG